MRGLAVTQSLRDAGARTDALTQDWATAVRLLLGDRTFSSTLPPHSPGG
jgi:hypothetical protein